MATTFDPCKKSGLFKKGHQPQLLCARLARIAEQGPTAIEERLRELDREWTSGRLVKATCGVLMLVSLALTAFVSPWWLILGAATGVVLLPYLFQSRGWLAHVFTGCGFRSGAQVEDERIALRVLRGDFRDLPTLRHIEDRDALSRMEDEGGIAVDDEDREDKFEPRHAAAVILAGNQTTYTAA